MNREFHGSYAKYRNNGCRCAECTNAYQKWLEKQRERRAAQFNPRGRGQMPKLRFDDRPLWADIETFCTRHGWEHWIVGTDAGFKKFLEEMA